MTAPTANRTSAIVRWEDPPLPANNACGRGPQSRYFEVADALRANPGRWALVAESESRGTSATARHIRTGSMTPFAPCGDFDAVSRYVDGKTLIYARYLGDGGEDW